MIYAIEITHHTAKGKEVETWSLSKVGITLAEAWKDAMRTARSMLEHDYAITAISVTPRDE